MILDQYGEPLARDLKPTTNCRECGAAESKQVKTLGRNSIVCMSCGAFQGEGNDREIKSR